MIFDIQRIRNFLKSIEFMLNFENYTKIEVPIEEFRKEFAPNSRATEKSFRIMLYRILRQANGDLHFKVEKSKIIFMKKGKGFKRALRF